LTSSCVLFWIRDVIRCFFFVSEICIFLLQSSRTRCDLCTLNERYSTVRRKNSRLRFENCTKSIFFSSFGWRANNKKISPSRIRISNRDNSLITIRHCITNSCPLPLHVRHKKKKNPQHTGNFSVRNNRNNSRNLFVSRVLCKFAI
jgi:hypothetical protein